MELRQLSRNEYSNTNELCAIYKKNNKIQLIKQSDIETIQIVIYWIHIWTAPESHRADSVKQTQFEH